MGPSARAFRRAPQPPTHPSELARPETLGARGTSATDGRPQRWALVCRLPCGSPSHRETAHFTSGVQHLILFHTAGEPLSGVSAATRSTPTVRVLRLDEAWSNKRSQETGGDGVCVARVMALKASVNIRRPARRTAA